MSQKWVVVPWEKFTNQTGSGERATILSIDSILSTLPKQAKRDASAILQHVQRTPDITWNEKGELVLKEQPIPGTHISDLLKDAFYKYKNWKAKGADSFYRSLAESNLPQGLIHNPERRILLESYKHPKPPGTLAKTWLTWK